MTTMRAVVIEAPGPPEVLSVRSVPLPVPHDGEVLIRVMAFGLNRSELHFRQGVAESGSFPRIPGIEAVGVVESAPGGTFAVGAQAATLMGGMGREFDGGYAEFVKVPEGQVIPFTSHLSWATWVLCPRCCRPQPVPSMSASRPRRGRRCSSAVAPLRSAWVLAKLRGLTVISTTRNPERVGSLRSLGVDHVLIDDGQIAAAVRDLMPGGVDCAVELVGVNVLKDTLLATKPGGTVCFTGMLSDEWTIRDFYPMDWLPNGVRLTAYSGGAADLTPQTLQGFLDAVAAGSAVVPVGRIYRLDEIVQAHHDMQNNVVGGKGVVLTDKAG